MTKQLLNGKIDLKKITSNVVEKVTLKSGEEAWLVPIVVWVGTEPDQYGNHASVQLSQTEAQRTAKDKKVYLGNLKRTWSDAPVNTASNEQQPQGNAKPNEENMPWDSSGTDDLPF